MAILRESYIRLSRFNEDESASGDDANEDEHSVSATVASPRFQDRAQQNTTRSVGSAGYLGKSSVVHWIEELMIKLVASSLVLEETVADECTAHDLSLGSFDPLTTMDNEANLPETGALLMQDCTYFSGEIPQSQLSGISQSINAALQLPPKSTGELLIRSYFSTVHPVFPIIPEEDFVFQYHSYYQTTQPPNGSCLWVAILNVVFAIGALYTRYVQIPCERLEDHIIYWIRSRVLGQEPIQMTGLPTMEHIRLLTISGMYCIASYQINRASYLIALGVRYAYSRALHLANTDPNITDEERELQVKVWHSLCSIERLLSFLTGLPSSIQDRFISVRLPRANDTYPSLNPAVGHLGAQAISGSRKGSLSCHLNTFVASLRLDSIVSEALSALYSSSTVNRTWARVQQTVVDLDRKLAHWQSDLTPGLIISPEHDNIAITPLIERMYLSLRFLGARMLINRPSLCDIYELNAAIPSQSEASRRLDTDAAVRCISAARSLVQLLPAHFDAAEFYRSTPWWCALNYLIQAGVVLMMEISFDAQHIPAETDDIITESILVIRWLETLSATSDPARRACLSLNRLLKLALDKVGRHPGNNLPFPSDASSTPQTVPPTGLHFTGHESNFLSGTNWHPACPP
ncbi:hypothetical protein PRK78_000257 [Emydomyces testavorans]|uniref:Xylanolytic transcriptional activator regulatory domain-containing protein n=1 Tax=Emydomyces testavorans TaxID=2070801 RepID=A0AAF0DC63_9EURO|nr:hypothetical protein PRK78_000257 [Emydomyces testavorans]